MVLVPSWRRNERLWSKLRKVADNFYYPCSAAASHLAILSEQSPLLVLVTLLAHLLGVVISDSLTQYVNMCSHECVLMTICVYLVRLMSHFTRLAFVKNLHTASEADPDITALFFLSIIPVCQGQFITVWDSLSICIGQDSIGHNANTDIWRYRTVITRNIWVPRGG